MKTLFLLLAINWNADLTHLATEIRKIHPNPPASVIAGIEQLKTRTAAMKPHEVVVELARIIASAGDGHTRLTMPLDPAYGFFSGHSKTDPPKHPELMFHAVPTRYVFFSDGLFTTDGQRVTRIGKMSAEDAIRAVWPVAHGDNDWQKKQIVAQYLAIPEILHARGVIDALPETFDAPAAPKPPLKPFAFEYREREKAVVFTYNEVANTKEETLAAFAERMFRFIDEHEVSKLIIDLRENYGGNGSLNRSIVHGIIRAKKLQEPGSLFVLTGRRTFSAAIMLAIALEEHTKAIFIGEPTGGKPNHYGDSRKVLLPETGLTVRVSSLYWQLSDPRDKRDTIAPHVLAEPTREGDLAMAEALDYFGGTPTSAIEGSWEGFVTADHNRVPFSIADGQVKPDCILKAGTKRLAGTCESGGLKWLVTAARAPRSPANDRRGGEFDTSRR